MEKVIHWDTEVILTGNQQFSDKVRTDSAVAGDQPHEDRPKKG